MSNKYVSIVREYIIPYAELKEFVQNGSNNTGSALEDEIFEEAEMWIYNGWLPVTERKQVVSYR